MIKYKKIFYCTIIFIDLFMDSWAGSIPSLKIRMLQKYLDHGLSVVVFVLKNVSLVPLDLNRSCVYILCK